MENDMRTVENLFNGRNKTEAEANMWLSPLKNTYANSAANAKGDRDEKREPNFVSVFFNSPVAVSALRLWNYAKTPERGVNEFELEIDGKQVYRGYCAQYNKDQHLCSTVVLFTGHG